jgi:hypothetical protein
MLRYLLLVALVSGLPRTVSAAELKAATVTAFDTYIQLTEQPMATDLPILLVIILQ